MKKISERLFKKIVAACVEFETIKARYDAMGEHSDMQQSAFAALTRNNDERVAFIASLAGAERDEAGAYIVSQEVFYTVSDLAY